MKEIYLELTEGIISELKDTVSKLAWDLTYADDEFIFKNKSPLGNDLEFWFCSVYTVQNLVLELQKEMENFNIAHYIDNYYDKFGTNEDKACSYVRYQVQDDAEDVYLMLKDLYILVKEFSKGLGRNIESVLETKFNNIMTYDDWYVFKDVKGRYYLYDEDGIQKVRLVKQEPLSNFVDDEIIELDCDICGASDDGKWALGFNYFEE